MSDSLREALDDLLNCVDGQHDHEWLQRCKDKARAALSAPQADAAYTIDQIVTLTYTNYRGETAQRHIIPKSVRFGSTEWHPEPGWLLLAWDADKRADREFALKDFGTAPPSQSAQMRKALEECISVLELVEQPAIRDTDHTEEVHALGERMGYGALMSAASAEWRASLEDDGLPTGGELVAGPCYATVLATLKKAREALSHADDGKESEGGALPTNLAEIIETELTAWRGTNGGVYTIHAAALGISCAIRSAVFRASNMESEGCKLWAVKGLLPTRELVELRDALKSVLSLFDDEGNLSCSFTELQSAVLDGYETLGRTKPSYELTKSEGGHESRVAAVSCEIPTQRSGESRDPLGDGSVNTSPHREDAAGVANGPSDPTTPDRREAIARLSCLAKSLPDDDVALDTNSRYAATFGDLRAILALLRGGQ